MTLSHLKYLIQSIINALKCFASIFHFLFFILFNDVEEVLICPNSKQGFFKCQKENAWIFFLGLKYLPDRAQIYCQFLSTPDHRVSGLINDLKNMGQFYLSGSAPHHSNENTVSNRNLLSSVIRILTFTLLWHSQLKMISIFFFFFRHYLSNPGIHGEKLAHGILHWTPITNFAASTIMIWPKSGKHISATPLSGRQGVFIVTYNPKEAKSASKLFIFVAIFSAWSATKWSVESHCTSLFILNQTWYGATWQNTSQQTSFECISPLLHAHPSVCWGKEEKGEGISMPSAR